jgi:hypothetical protein
LVEALHPVHLETLLTAGGISASGSATLRFGHDREMTMGVVNRPVSRNNSLALVLAFSITVLISPLVHTVGFRAAVYMPMYIALIVLVLAWTRHRLDPVVVLLGLLVVVTALIPAIHHSQVKFVFFALNILLAIGFTSLLSRGTIVKAIELSSYLLIVLLVLAVASFFFVFFGGQPVGIYVSPEQREIYWIWGSLAYIYHTPIGTLARPTGIYDEPGTFSFVVCAVAAVRHLCGLKRSTTWMILSLGLFTFSLAHIVYVAIHFLAESSKFRFVLRLALPLLVAGFLLHQSGAISAFNEALLSRFGSSASEGRLIAGDNRTIHLQQDAAKIVSSSGMAMLFGHREAENCCNPLWPMVERGLLGSWPYYLILLVLLGFGLASQRNIVLIGVALLFMQRPMVQSAGYSFLAAVPLVVILSSRFRRHSLAWIKVEPEGTQRNNSNRLRPSDPAPG